MFLILDTETNGRTLHGVWTNKQHIIRLSYSIVDSSTYKIVKKRDYFISDVATKIYASQTTYTTDDIKKGENWEKVFKELVEDIRSLPPKSKIIAHNISFDSTVIIFSAKCKQLNQDLIDEFTRNVHEKGWCSMKGTVNLCKLLPMRYDNYKFPKLIELYQHLYKNNTENNTMKNHSNNINTSKNNNNQHNKNTTDAMNNVEILIKCVQKLNAIYKSKKT